jgi:putative ABC transport system permease protein
MKLLHGLQEGISIGLVSLKTNKLRSSLTILGVSIGVGVIVIIAALVTGIRSSIIEAFENAGPNNFIVMRFDFTSVQIGGGTQLYTILISLRTWL